MWYDEANKEEEESDQMKKKIAFFDTKPYDRIWFEKLEHKEFEFRYFENKLNEDTASLAKGCKGVVAFVNDDINTKAIEILVENGVEVLAMRSSGYNNIDFKTAFEQKLTVLRVPSYSPSAIAEFTMGVLLTLNRKIHKAHNRTRDYNFTLTGLIGFDLNGKTIGVIGTGQIGRLFIDICKGFKMNVLAYDPYPAKDSDLNYVDLDTIFRESDVISLHCPLTKETHHLINAETIAKMKDGVYILNTSRGAIIESMALLEALKSKKIGGACLDVYEEESEFFFDDFSEEIIDDEVLAFLVSLPNVIVTSHQAFFTQEALENIADTTIKNLKAYFDGSELPNEICYQCTGEAVGSNCPKRKNGRCF